MRGRATTKPLIIKESRIYRVRRGAEERQHAPTESDNEARNHSQLKNPRRDHSEFRDLAAEMAESGEGPFRAAYVRGRNGSPPPGSLY